MTSLHGKPDPEISIGPELVSDLLKLQHPDLAALSITSIEAGWDNAMFRLGDSWMVRLPRRAIAAQLLEHEQYWLPQLAPRLSVAVPTPYRIGYPSPQYPWNWSVVPWIDGVTADQRDLDTTVAQQVALFLRSLHQPASANAPYNPFRSVPLQQRAPDVEKRMRRLATTTSFITPTIQQIWHDALSVDPNTDKTWIHGDLHPRNILVNNGAIAGIIDWGDFTAGDVATDLASIWMLFSTPEVRQQALDTYGITPDVLCRAKGWTIFFGVLLLDEGRVNDPSHAAIGERTLRHLDDA